MKPDITVHDHTAACWWDVAEARWACGPTEGQLVDVRDMLVVHTALLRELRLLPRSIRATDAADYRRVRAVAGHLAFVCGLLHHHHEGEDALLWPLLRARTAAAGALDAGAGQHADIAASLARVEQLRLAWTTAADDPGGARLAATVDVLFTVVAAHLEFEERMLLPLAAMLLTRDEWAAIGAAAVAATPKPLLPLTFGLFAYEGDPQVLRSMLAKAPLVPRLLLPRLAPRVYARRARSVHGTSRP